MLTECLSIVAGCMLHRCACLLCIHATDRIGGHGDSILPMAGRALTALALSNHGGRRQRPPPGEIPGIRRAHGPGAYLPDSSPRTPYPSRGLLAPWPPSFPGPRPPSSPTAFRAMQLAGPGPLASGVAGPWAPGAGFLIRRPTVTMYTGAVKMYTHGYSVYSWNRQLRA